MKKFFLICFVFLLFGCTKRDPLVPPSDFISSEGGTCVNGSQDSNEYGVDCGPDCSPCAYQGPGCTTTSMTTSNSQNSFVAQTVTVDTSSNYVVLATAGSYFIQYTFLDRPSVGVYTTTGNGSLFNSDDVQVDAKWSASEYYASQNQNEVYVNQEGDSLSIEICNVDFFSWVTGLTVPTTSHIAFTP